MQVQILSPALLNKEKKVPNFQHLGRILKQIWAKGTKSEHEAYVLATTDGTGIYKIRCQGARPFELDPTLEQFENKDVCVTGVINNGSIVANKVELM